MVNEGPLLPLAGSCALLFSLGDAAYLGVSLGQSRVNQTSDLHSTVPGGLPPWLLSSSRGRLVAGSPDSSLWEALRLLVLAVGVLSTESLSVSSLDTDCCLDGAEI